MRIEDLAYLLEARDRPGRSTLSVNSDSSFSNTATEAAGLIDLILPMPAAAFIRLWTLLTATISAAVATDLLIFGYVTPDIDINFIRYQAFGALAEQVPLIGGIHVAVPGGVLAGTLVLPGLEPIMANNRDQLRVRGVVTAASGQTLTVVGKYVDLPV
jgi:hypothetical protein